MKFLIVPILIALPVIAPGQVRIDGHGVRNGNVVIDASGVHTGGTRVDRRGVHSGAGGGGTTVSTNGGSRTIDCRGGSATIIGNHNQIVASRCASVSVPGNDNVLTLHFAAPGNVSLMGNRNRARITAPASIHIGVDNIGTANTVAAN